MSKVRKPRFIKPPNTLKQKVGTGGLDEATLAKSQDYIDSNKGGVDFVSYAEQYLKEFSSNIRNAQKNKEDIKKTRDEIIRPVMQLKANGGMFQYHLVSYVADIALQFLENIDAEKINDETFDVLLAHERTLRVIIASNLKGSGGKEGNALVQELDQACKRYFTKHGKG